MSYQKITRQDPTGAREKAMANVKPIDDITPKTSWLDELLYRMKHGEILQATQIDMLRRAGKI